MFILIIICNIQNLNKALHQLLNSNKQEMFNKIGNTHFEQKSTDCEVMVRGSLILSLFWMVLRENVKNEHWKGCRGRYVSIGIEEQLDTTWWEELQDAWDLNLPNIIFQG